MDRADSELALAPLGPPPPASSDAVSKSMRGNRKKDTGPELELRRLLRERGLGGYRVAWAKAPGSPDIAYPGRHLAVFVNGCFWHRCPHCEPPLPKTNSEFWHHKFVRNQERDLRKVRQLEDAGWTVLTVWECQLKSDPGGVLEHLRDALATRSSNERR
jgi:DNA mismatch endonuclease (patch repair protein)